MDSRHNDALRSARSWRLSLWLCFCLAAMAAATLHILIDFGVGLFPMRGTLTFPGGATLVLISLIHVWWCVSLIAGTHEDGGGVASAAVLALGWTALTNGSAIVFCPPACPYASPLSDVAHIGSVVLGILAAVVAIMTLWRRRMRISWGLPIGALALVLATVVALANSAVDI